MFTAHPTLLIGPSDWQPQQTPQEEFNQRIDALWELAPSASRAVVFGSPARHAELAYFTNLVPKLEACVALLSRGGGHRLFIGGGANMVGAARPLSFITDLAPLAALGPALKDPAPTVLIGGGAMPAGPRQMIGDALGNTAQDATAPAWALMRRKSHHERAAIRAACTILSAAMAAIGAARRSGASVTAATLAGEKAANAQGAQDVRTLLSLDGGRTLRPFELRTEDTGAPLQVYMAVRRSNYWAEGFALFSADSPTVAKEAAIALRAALAATQAGALIAPIAKRAEASMGGRIHPAARPFACRLGIALEDAPHTQAGETFEAGEIYSLRVGITGTAHAIVSAVIAVHADGTEVLWRTPAEAA
jgi:hypothetical protein